MTRRQRVTLFALSSSAAYLALAILGGGGLDAFFAHPARLVLTLAFVALVIASVAGLYVLGKQGQVAASVGLVILVTKEGRPSKDGRGRDEREMAAGGACAAGERHAPQGIDGATEQLRPE